MGGERSLRGVAILVVEADRALGRTMLGFIEAAGAFGVVVESAEEAVMEAAGRGPRFNAAVIGASLPDGCGVELVRALEPHLPPERIFITANYHFTPASDAGPAAVTVERPLTVRELVRALADVLSSRNLPAPISAERRASPSCRSLRPFLAAPFTSVI
jgi:DNA-binding NtrC family response regulator